MQRLNVVTSVWTGLSFLLLLTRMMSSTNAFNYNITSAGTVALRDVSTGIADLRTMFIGDETDVSVKDVEWSYTGLEGGADVVLYQTWVDGVLQAEGNFSLLGVDRELPTEIDCGTIRVDKAGRSTVEVILEVDAMPASTSAEFQVYKPGVSLIPILFILIMALTTQMVELSLFLGVFIGACIVSGTLMGGFQDTLNIFLLNALSDVGHVYVILFTVFLSGTVGMMQKSGGMLGFTRDVAKIATTPRTGQFACLIVGCLIFFDDYANCLLAGESMRPLTDLLSVSREKLSFIVDATAAPIASISPVSSWVGFEVGLIDTQLQLIIQRVAETGGELYITDSAFEIFLQSIKYRYYPIFMIVLMMVLIGMGRDFGPMLVAERQVRVYDRTDGGPNHGKSGQIEGDGDNQPRVDQPLLSVNMLVPIMILVILIFVCLVNSGDDGSGTQSFMDKIQNSDSYVALLYGTMGTAWISLVFYLLQITIPGTGKLCMWTPARVMKMISRKKADPDSSEADDEPSPRFLMSVSESVESFLFGMARIFLALIVLTLAWASGEVMTAIGADRLFAAWIVGGIPAEVLPTLSFVVSLFMALATGTSWGTMAILFPLLLVPTYIVADGDAQLFYAVVAGVLSGSVAGDHMSPISDTTVLSALASDVTLMAHVNTQAPYAIAMIIFSIIFGTLPIGYEVWPNMIGICLGWVMTVAFVYGICVPVISPTGRWDIFTKYCCGRRYDPVFMEELTQDCIKKASGEVVAMRGEEGSSDDDDIDLKKREDATGLNADYEELDATKEAAVDEDENKMKSKADEEVEA